MLARIEAIEAAAASKSKMGTLQSIMNVHCCSSKKDDELSDDEPTEGKAQQAAQAVCVAEPWESRPRAASAPAPVAFPRSVSNATTIPTPLQK